MTMDALEPLRALLYMRRDLKISVRKLAMFIGINQSGLGRILEGIRYPTDRTLWRASKVAEAMGLHAYATTLRIAAEHRRELFLQFNTMRAEAIRMAQDDAMRKFQIQMHYEQEARFRRGYASMLAGCKTAKDRAELEELVKWMRDDDNGEEKIQG